MADAYLRNRGPATDHEAHDSTFLVARRLLKMAEEDPMCEIVGFVMSLDVTIVIDVLHT